MPGKAGMSMRKTGAQKGIAKGAAGANGGLPAADDSLFKEWEKQHPTTKSTSPAKKGTSTAKKTTSTTTKASTSAKKPAPPKSVGTNRLDH